MIFTTLNSVYEIDDDRPVIRRITGARKATPRQGKDGEWREYMVISDVELGHGVLIVWNATGQCTYLSEVTEINPPERAAHGEQETSKEKGDD